MRKAREREQSMPRNKSTVAVGSFGKRLVWLVISFCMLSGPPAAATAPVSQVQAEITHLLEFVQSSQCEFNRNGTWYSGHDARLHLEMKNSQFIRRGLIRKAEDFIANAATRSSVSGRSYQIRCQDGKKVSSSRWLTEELQRYRKNGKRK